MLRTSRFAILANMSSDISHTSADAPSRFCLLNCLATKSVPRYRICIGTSLKIYSLKALILYLSCAESFILISSFSYLMNPTIKSRNNAQVCAHYRKQYSANKTWMFGDSGSKFQLLYSVLYKDLGSHLPAPQSPKTALDLGCGSRF